MRRTRAQALPLVLLLVAISCASAPNNLRQEPAKKLAGYQFDPNQPLVDRVQQAPDFLLRLLRTAGGLPSAAPYLPSQDEKQLVQRYLELLPKSGLAVLDSRLIGIYFVNNLNGSGTTIRVYDNVDTVYAIILMNPGMLHTNISDWLTYKENSCFLSDQGNDRGIQVHMDCGTQYGGLLYALLHETTHVLDYVYHYTPDTDSGSAPTPTPFTQGIWEKYDQPTRAADFPLRDKVTFYHRDNGPKIHLSQASRLYASLAQSPFASLYGSQNWLEDFAEFFTWYYYTTVLGQPFRITITRPGEPEITCEPMKSEAARRRAEAITNMLH